MSYQSKRKKRVDIRKFAGTIKLSEDPMEIQRQMRAEWDHRDQLIADALKHLKGPLRYP